LQELVAIHPGFLSISFAGHAMSVKINNNNQYFELNFHDINAVF